MKIENTQTIRMKSVIWPKRNENDYNYEGMLCPKTKAGMTDLPSPWIEVLRVVKKQRIQMHGCDHRKHFPPTWNVITFQSFKHQKIQFQYILKAASDFQMTLWTQLPTLAPNCPQHSYLCTSHLSVPFCVKTSPRFQA